MGIIFSLISLVEKNNFSLYKRMMLPILPMVPMLPTKTFHDRCVFFLIGSP